MSFKFHSVTASPANGIHDASATSVRQSTSPCGNGTSEQRENSPHGMSPLGTVNSSARFLATGNLALSQEPVAPNATPSPALSHQQIDAILNEVLSLVEEHLKTASPDAISRQQIDAMLNEVLSLVEAHQKKMPPARSRSAAAPQQRNASAHSTASPQAATSDERPSIPNTGHRLVQWMRQDGNRTQRRLFSEFGQQDSQESGSSLAPHPGQPSTSGTVAELDGFDPDELSQAMLASIESEELRQATLASIELEKQRQAKVGATEDGFDPDELSQAMLASIESEELRQATLASIESENLRRAVMASAGLAKAYFDMYPSGLAGSAGRREDPANKPEPNTATAHDASLDIAWTDSVYLQMGPCNQRFSTWLKNNNMRTVPTSGAGNNCLIVSLLGHATGHYDVDHRAQAEQLRTKLIEKFPNLGKDEMLRPDMPEVDFLLELLERSHPPVMHIAEVQPDVDGIPQMLHADGTPFSSMTELEGRRIAPIFQQGAHFEAIVARS